MALEYHTNMVGVIPSFDLEIDFGFEWDNCLMPIDNDLTLIERAVLECATVGCSSIWIACNPHMIPLVQERMGEVVLDPVWANRNMDAAGWRRKRHIPLFYVPINSKDIYRRESVSWQILYAAHSSYYVSKFISKWTTYDRVYVASPFGIFDHSALRSHRATIRKNNCLISFEGKTILDNIPLGFSFSPEEFIKSRRNFRKLDALKGKEVRYSKPSEVFGNIKDKEHELITIEEFYDATTFEGLREYFKSDITFKVKEKNFLLPKLWLNRVNNKEKEK